MDRGRLVRREDPNLGDESTANQANLNTFHFTNCSPQITGFIQKTWWSLEDYLLKKAELWKEHATVGKGGSEIADVLGRSVIQGDRVGLCGFAVGDGAGIV